MEKNNLIKIENIDQINIVEGIKEFNNIQKIKINFKELSENVLNNFIIKHKNLENIYLMKNYKINIDIIEYDFEFYLFFIDCVEKAHDYILNSEYDITLFENIKEFNFCIVQDIMFNFPFTLDNIIYMPINYIQENYIKKDSISLIRTIIHEKIHIGQRYNEFIWTKYINFTDSNWIKIYKSDEKFNIIEKNLEKNKISLINNREEFISNPDTYYENFKYLYKINNNFYYGHYIYNLDNKNISIRYFELSDEKKILLKTNIKFEQEHPYEKYAYTISEKII